jgi:hypothetical protein
MYIMVRTIVSVNVDSDVFEEFKDSLPRRKSVSQAVRELIEESIEESKKAQA